MSMSHSTTLDTRYVERIGTAGEFHRASARQQKGKSQEQNVGGTERKVSLASGAILALLGLRRMDLPGLVIAGVGGSLLWRGMTGQCSVYRALGINTASDEERRGKSAAERGVHISESFLIDKPVEELYAYWRKLENLPRIMSHLESVDELSGNRSHWRAEAPTIYGGHVEWDAEITADEQNRLIEWRSLPGADVENEGSVSFRKAPGERGTIIHVEMHYAPPAGQVGQWIVKLMGQAPDQQIREDLRRFKRTMEIGEAPTTEGQSHGSCMGLGALRK